MPQFVNAIVLPSGDQAGSDTELQPSGTNSAHSITDSRGSEPSAFAILIAWFAPSNEPKAILSPSGDQIGETPETVPWEGVGVMFLRSLPSGRIVRIR